MSNIKERTNKIIEATNGKKTESVGLLMVLFQILMIIKPDLVSPNSEKIIDIVISSGVLTTLSHRVWRNRKNIINYIKQIFTKND